MSGSKLFRRNRALGYVTNHIPAAVRYIRRRKENVIVTCIGRLFHTYSCNHFRLICVSGLHPDEITCIASDNYCVYAASDKQIFAWRSGNVIKHTYKGHKKNVHLMLPFGNHLISVDETSCMKIWNIRSEELYLELPFSNEEFQISALMHPPTYSDKILLASAQGSIQLWNIKHAKLIHTFQSVGSRINCLVAAPAVDVAAIGLQNGEIILLNLKFDERIMEFKQDWGAVTGITFRTDGHPIMATASTNGQIVFWDLEEKKIASQLIAHEKTITTTICLASEPLLFTTSPDNSMKLWIFDMPDGGARLLRIREGHAAPPLCIRYHGAKGQHILSSGEDSSLRVFNTVTETLNKSMGKASYNRKASKKKNRFQENPFLMPPIVNFTSETTREKEWDNIASIHSGLVMATTWSFHKNKMGELKLVPEKFQNKNRTDFNAEATCICISHCGNFVIIGYSSGDAERFNIQSGIHRGKYGNPVAHQAAIRGVGCDNLNQFIVTGGSDGYIKFWNFKDKTAQPITKIQLNDGVAMFRNHTESAILCVALDNFSISILDLDTRTIIRQFVGHKAQITDACFNPDSRWLITSSMDCTIKIWDIPSSYLIDHFKVEKACISLTMSPTGDFLATAHVNNLGLFLWANKSLFSHISLRSINPESEPQLLDLPTSITTNDNNMNIVNDDDFEGELIELNYKSPIQLNTELITMSTVAAAKWQYLLDIDIVKKRNKPKQPPKKPKQAPFFIPTIAGLDMKFDLSTAELDDNGISKLIVPDNFMNLSLFGRILDKSIQTGSLNESIEHLMNIGPSMIDFEIKSLHPLGGGSVSLMLQFMKMIEFMLKSNLNFELAQTYLGVFLKAHGQTVVNEKKLRDYLEPLEAAQIKGWTNLEDKLLYGLGVVSALRNFTL